MRKRGRRARPSRRDSAHSDLQRRGQFPPLTQDLLSGAGPGYNRHAVSRDRVLRQVRRFPFAERIANTVKRRRWRLPRKVRRKPSVNTIFPTNCGARQGKLVYYLLSRAECLFNKARSFAAPSGGATPLVTMSRFFSLLP